MAVTTLDVMTHPQDERHADREAQRMETLREELVEWIAHTALRVGYRDAAHFNREYKSLFGVPPMRDVHRLREATRASAS